MAQLLAAPYSYFADANGAPLSGGKIFTYIAGTTTPQAAYTNASGTVPLANPVILDSAGRAQIWLNGFYKIVVEDSLGNVVSTTDNVTAINATGNMNTSVYDPANIQQQVVGTTAVQTLTNKTIDASQNNLINLPMPYSAIGGCLPTSISGTNTTAAIAVSAGQAADSTNTNIIKSVGYSWAASNGNAINGTDAVSATLTNNQTYHMFLCSGGSGTGTFSSASLTPTFPSGYTTYTRRIFSFLTNGSGTPFGMNSCFECEGGSYKFYYTTAISDQTNFTVGSTSTLFSVSTPNGIRSEHLGTYNNSSTTVAMNVSSPDQPSIAATAYDIETSSAATAFSKVKDMTTNTSQQLAARAASSISTLNVTTFGYKDFRRV